MSGRAACGGVFRGPGIYDGIGGGDALKKHCRGNGGTRFMGPSRGRGAEARVRGWLAGERSGLSGGLISASRPGSRAQVTPAVSPCPLGCWPCRLPLCRFCRHNNQKHYSTGQAYSNTDKRKSAPRSYLHPQGAAVWACRGIRERRKQADRPHRLGEEMSTIVRSPPPSARETRRERAQAGTPREPGNELQMSVIKPVI
ncbi:hypothetical protein AAFF_G00262200 [Aldrovandia affinis]|uniref:Uncharacterized protein n=1 Tax=Aldrovandia affinis TaxID=143900 RepID=A0AAD7STP7_9TELE|nr:hypothetical protein AAFF_G00262200 [Aldrovandia affinis]